MTPAPNEVTQLLVAWSNGDSAARDALMPLVHDELRRLAPRYMGRSGTVLEKDELLGAIWPDAIVEENNLT
jgi:hypothetical protein